jgi:preprotein translocase subunit SecG
MNVVLIVILSLVTLAMIGVILLQRSEGGGLVGGGNPTGGFMSARGTANLLTKATGVLAAIFMTLCIVLAILSGRGGKETTVSALDALSKTSSSQAPAPEAPVSR